MTKSNYSLPDVLLAALFLTAAACPAPAQTAGGDDPPSSLLTTPADSNPLTRQDKTKPGT
jgi:hypothetical protein